MKQNLLVFIYLFVLLINCAPKKSAFLPEKSVDPFIGTDAHGHTFPGATAPFGMVQLSPDTDIEGWDWCSGYHSSDISIKGFSHKHLSGTGASDYGDILFMPTVGEIKFNPGDKNKPETGYRSSFSHSSETAMPGYYAVHLADYDIDVELSVTKRTGIHRYKFPKAVKSNIIIDLVSGIHDRPVEAYIKIINNNEIVGYRRSSGWARDQKIYFVAKFSSDFSDYGFQVNGESVSNNKRAEGEKVKGFLRFQTEEDEIIEARVGISAVDIAGARKNLEQEVMGKDFSSVRQAAEKQWHNALKHIEIKADDDVEEIFYTALYHSMIAPNLFMDVDRRYRGMDDKIHVAEDFTNYTVFSLWDTFRATHPLFTILFPKKVNNMIRTFQKKYEQSGLLPVWELDANETNCMIGYHSIPVIVDAYMKGITDYDVEKIYHAMVTSAKQDEHGIKFYKKYGFIPSNLEPESVSKTLEYAYDDWCIATMADKLGKEEDAKYFMKRAQNYLNLFDPKTKFMRPKTNEKFRSPFDPKSVSGHYTEANAWQYSFFVPQDIENLIKIFGGEQIFEKKLDQMFREKSNLTGKHQVDITGLIGQYAHGNEPSHHMAYLYNFIGKPYKTQKYVRKIMQELYTSERDGICGNEDCGQMSAWYVFSALGFYPVTPGSNYYVIGSPMIDAATINLPNGKVFKIRTKNQSSKNIYVKSVQFNDTNYSKSYITHSDIMNGGELVFEMSNKPNKSWGSKNKPRSTIDDRKTALPYLEYEAITFFDQQQIKINSIDTHAQLFYSLNQGEFKKYNSPVVIEDDTHFRAYAALKKNSDTIDVTFRKIPFKKKIDIKSSYADNYSAGGDIGLIDYVFGTDNFWTGEWQGYQGQDFEAVVDLMKPRQVSVISTRFLQAIGGWIFMPKKITYSISKTGDNYQPIAEYQPDVPMKQGGTIIKKFKKEMNKREFRYLKVEAIGVKTCPDWHKGAGRPAWIFIDEIFVE